MAEVLSLEVLNELKGFIQDKLPEVVRIYLQNSEKYVESIQAGFANGDAILIKDSAHPLKSSSGSLGLMALSLLCKELEHGAEAVSAGQNDLKSLEGLVNQIEPLFEQSAAQIKAAIES